MLTLRSVLCPTDFSAVSVKAEVYATAIARHFAASLHLLHVDPPMPILAPYGEIPVDPRIFEDQREAALADLSAAADRARTAGVPVETTLRGGQPAREILTAASEMRPDLVVIGTHGHGGVEHLLLGSVTEKVMRKAPCPVMVVPPGAHPESGVRFARILCPIDGSATSADALTYALSLARETDHQLTVLYVIEPVPAAGEFGALDVAEYQRLGEAHARQVLRDAVSDETRASCRLDERIATGKPSERILDAAAVDRADVIVMGVRGRGAIDVFAFGSTTNEVVRRATCPVLAVHPAATEAPASGPVPAATVV